MPGSQPELSPVQRRIKEFYGTEVSFIEAVEAIKPLRTKKNENKLEFLMPFWNLLEPSAGNNPITPFVPPKGLEPQDLDPKNVDNCDDDWLIENLCNQANSKYAKQYTDNLIDCIEAYSQYISCKEVNQSHDIISILIQPTQRIMRYSMLVDDIIKIYGGNKKHTQALKSLSDKFKSYAHEANVKQTMSQLKGIKESHKKEIKAIVKTKKTFLSDFLLQIKHNDKECEKYFNPRVKRNSKHSSKTKFSELKEKPLTKTAFFELTLKALLTSEFPKEFSEFRPTSHQLNEKALLIKAALNVNDKNELVLSEFKTDKLMKLYDEYKTDQPAKATIWLALITLSENGNPETKIKAYIKLIDHYHNKDIVSKKKFHKAKILLEAAINVRNQNGKNLILDVDKDLSAAKVNFEEWRHNEKKKNIITISTKKFPRKKSRNKKIKLIEEKTDYQDNNVITSSEAEETNPQDITNNAKKFDGKNESDTHINPKDEIPNEESFSLLDSSLGDDTTSDPEEETSNDEFTYCSSNSLPEEEDVEEPQDDVKEQENLQAEKLQLQEDLKRIKKLISKLGTKLDTNVDSTELQNEINSLESQYKGYCDKYGCDSKDPVVIRYLKFKVAIITNQYKNSKIENTSTNEEQNTPEQKSTPPNDTTNDSLEQNNENPQNHSSHSYDTISSQLNPNKSGQPSNKTNPVPPTPPEKPKTPWYKRGSTWKIIAGVAAIFVLAIVFTAAIVATILFPAVAPGTLLAAGLAGKGILVTAAAIGIGVTQLSILGIASGTAQAYAKTDNNYKAPIERKYVEEDNIDPSKGSDSDNSPLPPSPPPTPR